MGILRCAPGLTKKMTRCPLPGPSGPPPVHGPSIVQGNLSYILLGDGTSSILKG